MSDFDVIVIGAGRAGEVLAARAAAPGLSWHGIAPFPTRSEVWLNLLEAMGL